MKPTQILMLCADCSHRSEHVSITRLCCWPFSCSTRTPSDNNVTQHQSIDAHLIFRGLSSSSGTEMKVFFTARPSTSKYADKPHDQDVNLSFRTNTVSHILPC